MTKETRVLYLLSQSEHTGDEMFNMLRTLLLNKVGVSTV